ncbi:hypothetical protein IG195_02800 [Arthrobacter sp. TES]|uniref:hypothetical protein n=1 Tax=Paenarthrobacter ureafaciens TaxID=37931 RepID=UPI0003970C3C|nr:hypothetical protein [Paenarthrobacter ureafaciens]ERI37290.1 hypothetical protein M707_11935 [Arthrobacter sp. AK-YN10]QOI64055.1 hypothetical protein IG195_02800 [Arthrobacter sp. TES]
MWDTFFADVVVALVGAVLTVGIAYGTFRLQLRHNEKRVLRHLIWDLEHRRALSIGHPMEIPDAAIKDDYKRAGLSVVDIRDRVRQTVDQVQPKSNAQAYLSKMMASCHHYLEDSDASPNSYTFHLAELQRNLHEAVRGVASSVSGIDAGEPGSLAYSKH